MRRPTLTITGKVILAFTLVFGVLLTGFAFFIYESVHDSELAKLDARLESHADKLQTELEEQADSEIFPEKAEFAALATEGLTGVRYQLRTVEGMVILSDSVMALGKPASGGVSGRIVATRWLGDAYYRTLEEQVEVEGKDSLVLTVSAPYRSVEVSLQQLEWLFLITIPLGLCCASLAAYVIARAAFSPVLSMIAAADGFSADTLHSRIRVPGTRDEIRRLGLTLNSMMDRIQKAFDTQREFVADAAHEIRTPLTIIRGELEYVLDHPDGKEAQGSLRLALAEVDRLAEMAGNLLTLSRLEGTPTGRATGVFRLDEALVDCAQRMQPLFEENGIALRVLLDEPIEIPGDAEGIKRVILNLLDNARKYTDPGGTTTISLGRAAKQDGSAQITVEDTGRGIPPEDLPNIFRRFYRAADTRKQSRGSGLGLAIVERIVTLHGGTVAVESRPGKGTSVTVLLPLRA